MDYFWNYAFLQRGLAMAILGGGVCGAMGVFVVLWRMSLVGMSISHAAFAGALLSLMLGCPPLAGGVTASLLAAAIVGPLAERPGFSPDTAMGVIFSVVMGLAVMILGLMPGARTEGLSLVWGSLLTVDSLDLRLMACTAASSAGLWLSYEFALPPGAAIVLVATTGLIAAMVLSPKKMERRA